MNRFTWTTFLESLDRKYTSYAINREYREKHFKDEAEYIKVQRALAEEIETLDAEILKELRSFFQVHFPSARILLYDSKFFQKSQGTIGKVLVQGLQYEAEVLDVSAIFESHTGCRVLADRFESLSAEDQAEISKIVGDENGVL